MNFVDQWLGSGMIDISDPLGNQQLSFDFGERTRRSAEGNAEILDGCNGLVPLRCCSALKRLRGGSDPSDCRPLSFGSYR
jgi:hypothetical protein